MPSFIMTLQVIPALTNTTPVQAPASNECGRECVALSLTQVNEGFTEERSSGPSRLPVVGNASRYAHDGALQRGLAPGTLLGLVRPATNRVEKARRIGDA